MKPLLTAEKTASKVDKRKSPPPEQLERLKQHAFQPGVSGNPNGRPKEIMGAAYRRALLRKIPNDADGRIFADAVAQKMIDMAMKGDVKAVAEVTDRIDGKPSQSVTMGGDGSSISIQIASMTPEQKRRRLAELMAKARNGFQP
jgi:hypothetical protein